MLSVMIGVTALTAAACQSRESASCQSDIATVKLDHINTVIVDDVDGDWHASATRWTEPRLPLVGDWNLALASRSSELLRDLRCDIPMPDPSASAGVSQVPVITVCEKLKKR